jgi:hypothetical protein
MRSSAKSRVLVPLAAAILLSGCGTVKIGRILDDPGRFQNRVVRVDGVVDASFGAVVAGVYQVEDGSGKIYVLSNGQVPGKGARVSVTGRVMNGVTVGTRSFGTGIREQSHRVHY